MHGTTVNLRELIKLSVLLVEDAGFLIRSHYTTKNINARVKSSDSGPKNEMLTNFDVLSHQLLVSGLANEFPDLKVISEEHPPTTTSNSPLQRQRSSADVENVLPDIKFYVPVSDLTVWVDPLDATQEFSEGLLDYVTIMICVALHGYPVIGVVHQPFLNRTFWSWSSYAISNDLKRAMQNGVLALEKEAVAMSKNNSSISDDLSRVLKVTHSRSHLDASQLKDLFRPQQIELVPAGGSGYKVLSLIERKAHLYVHPSTTRLWDVCAAQAILEAAGGRLTGLDGTRLTYHAKDSVKVSKSIGLFAAASISEHKKWLPVVSSLVKKT